MNLEELRNEIDNIDDQIAELYVKRMAVVKSVGDFKKDNAVAVNQSDREGQILYRVTENVPNELQSFTKQVFTTMFDTSKAYQQSFVELNSPIVDELKSELAGEKKPFPLRATVACQGVKGAYSSLAAKKLFEIPNLMYFGSFEAVFSAVEKGFCKYGILPIENSTVGSVNAVYDLMKEHKFHIVKSIAMRVSHNLLVNDGVKASDIKEIVSHEQALNQCKTYIEENFKNVKITVCENTAIASQMVKDSGRKDIAAISSIECQDAFNLEVLEKNIQDSKNNYTRFICISKNLEVFENADKISIMCTLPHTPGSLNKLLTKFSTLGLNLTKIESRPLDGTSYKFMFYFDFMGDVNNVRIQNLIAESENSSEVFVMLGSYSEVRI